MLLLDIIDDVENNARLIKQSIRKYGYNAEHNFWHYKNSESKTNRNIFCNFQRGKGVLASVEHKHTWNLFPNGVLTPKSQRMDVFLDFLRQALIKKKAKKVVVEVDEVFRKHILDTLSRSRQFRPLTLNYLLYWPVFRMNLFDHKLKGKTWKKMRNINNRFQKRYRVRVVDSNTVPADKLLKIVKVWLRRRNHTDTVDEEYYYNVIRSGFKGMTHAKTIYVNGEPCTITGGWKIPNTSGHYYSSMGVCNYKHEGLGEYANLRDLLHLKKCGYKHVDFGGSDYALLNFKNKFKPHYLYKTYVFSIVRR